MQATIIIAHNISKPIKLLADICNKIANGNLEEKIMIRRSDEIGILADSFNNMIGKLQLNTYKLIEMKQFNEDILKNISTGIITIDRDENIVSKNQAAEDILKYNIKNLEDNTGLEEIILKQLQNTLTMKKDITHIYKLRNISSDDDYYLDVVTSILKTSKNKMGGAICSFNDITERKKIEKDIEMVNRLTSMGQLAAGMAHEIRNPLSGMKMSIQVLKKRLCTPYSKSNEDLFDGVLYEIDRLNNLITDLLNFAKPRLPRYEIINTIEILNKALYLTKKTALENGIKICVEEDSSKLLIYVDKDQIEQVFLNIITNGLKAIGSDGILDIKLNHSLGEKGNFVEIEFYDNGCGIKTEYIDKIFDPFFTTNSQGTGLGLSVVHKLVAENNGEIEVKSKENIGTSFKIIFPIYGGDECGKKYFNN
jgi:PAS domain S-box-containing protein